MATGGGGGSPQLWERDNPEQQGLVCTDENFKDLLNRESVRLCKLMTMSSMWPALRQLEVVSENQEQDMKLNASNSEMVHRLIRHINTGPLWWIHSLFRAFIISNQCHILKVVEVDSKQYDNSPQASVTVERVKDIPKLWDRDSPEQQHLVCEDDHCSKLLNRQRVELCESVMMAPMWPVLRQLEIISAKQEEDIKFNATNSEMVHRLIDHINRRPMWTLHGFLHACAASNQHHILDLLEVDSDLYYDTPPPSPQQPEQKHLIENPHQYLKGEDKVELHQPSTEPHTQTTEPVVDSTQSSEIPAQESHTANQAGLPNPRSELQADLIRKKPALSQPTLDLPPHVPGSSRTAPNQPPPCPSTPHPGHSTPLEPEVIRIISDHARGCLRILMHHNLYDIGDSPTGKVIHIGKIYIKVDTHHETNDGNFTEIPEKDILRCLPGESSLRVVQVHGPPGAGKTALAEHVVCDWAKKFLENLEKFGLTGIDEDLFTTMVFIPSRAIKNNVDEGIMEHLLCKEQDKKVLFNHVKQGNGIGLALDATDEIRSKAVLGNVREYLRYQHTSGDGTCILVTSRSDLGQIESTNFDRLLVLQGFSWDQGIDYIKAYFPGDRSEKVLKYTQAHRQQVFSIVTNPLRAHIYCALISEGELKLDENDDISILKLFHLLEKCLIRRKGVKITDEQCRNMYRLCMHGLLHGVRHFSQALFDEFSIAEGSHVFFIRREKTSPMGSEVSYSFPHEMMYEYFAGRYIDSLSFDSSKALILSISSNPAFRNLQKIIFEVLLHQDQSQLMQLMARAILILQHECSEENKPKGLFQRFTLYSKLVNLHEQIQPLETIDLSLLALQSQKQAKETNRIWNIINKVFDDKSSGLKKTKWYLGLGNGVFAHVTECFQSCTPELRATLSKNTTEHLLPCEYQDKKGRRFVCPVGESRWAEVTFNRTNDVINVNGWTTKDAIEALHQARESASQSCGSVTVDSLTLNISQYRNLWGQPPSSSSSPRESKYSEELQHWSCERIQFPCSSEMSHNSKVVFHPRNEKIDVQAKNVQDAKVALSEVRLSAADSCRLPTFKSMTISVDEQPPKDSSSPAEDDVLSEELGHWLHISKSHYFMCTVGKSSRQFICAVGTARWAAVVYGDEEIQVGAWCLEDATDVLHQARRSATHSQGQLNYKRITLNVNKNWSLWGQPPSSAFSPQVCDDLTTELESWSEICKSIHIVYAVGTSRYSEVVYKNDEIHVQAWCLKDINECQYQARQTALYGKQTFKSMTLNVDKYKTLWGMPSSSPSVEDVHQILHLELEHWSQICTSHHINWTDTHSSRHFVCSVGTDRYGEVVYTLHTNTINVHAWCEGDVQQLLHQYRMSGAASQHVQGVRGFNLYINQYHSLWGQPPGTASTPDVWTQLSAELAQWSDMCTENYVYYIYLCETTPLHGLLLSGMRTRVRYVQYGTIDMEDLYRLVHTGQLTHVGWFARTSIVVPAGGDRAGLSNMRKKLVQAKGAMVRAEGTDGRLLVGPDFVTQTGGNYTWSDGYKWGLTW